MNIVINCIPGTRGRHVGVGWPGVKWGQSENRMCWLQGRGLLSHLHPCSGRGQTGLSCRPPGRFWLQERKKQGGRPGRTGLLHKSFRITYFCPERREAFPNAPSAFCPWAWALRDRTFLAGAKSMWLILCMSPMPKGH